MNTSQLFVIWCDWNVYHSTAQPLAKTAKFFPDQAIIASIPRQIVIGFRVVIAFGGLLSWLGNFILQHIYSFKSLEAHTNQTAFIIVPDKNHFWCQQAFVIHWIGYVIVISISGTVRSFSLRNFRGPPTFEMFCRSFSHNNKRDPSATG